MKTRICKAEIPEGKEFDYLIELKDVLLRDNISEKYPILNTNKSLKDICVESLGVLSDNLEEVKTVMDYIVRLKFQNKLIAGSKLEKLFQKMIEKHGITSQDHLIDKLNGNIELVKIAIPFSDMACSAEKAQTIVKENLQNAVPILLDLLEILTNDSTEDGKKVQKTLANIIFGIEKR